VHEAANGEEVKAALGSGKLNVGIVFADMTTVGSGFQLQAWIKSQIPDVEIILAGSIEKALDQAREALQDGPALVKLYEHHLILDRIRKSLSRRAQRL
jgi:hypothetical protein